MAHTRSKVARFIFDNSLLLLLGTAAAVIWANLHLASYEDVANPLHFAVNDVGMVFFFALAAKEVFEATLSGGPLASPRRALSPLAAAVGGMVAPALIYVALASTRGPADLIGGWAIPCATDIAFSAMVARLIFRRYFGGAPAMPASCSKLQCVSAATSPDGPRNARPPWVGASVRIWLVSTIRSSVRSRRARAAS
jgi:Na+/H+ antiporter 1